MKDVHDVSYQRNYVTIPQPGQAAFRNNADFRFGLRICPNLECRGLVAVINANEGDGLKLVRAYPPELINLRTENIPSKLLASMREAIASHSVEAYRASALMIRRTLEILCELKNAKGANLKERLSKLSQHAILPQALLDAADHLRLMGNDAAHVEAKDYDDIDKEHSEIAIEVAREILKAVYQHDDLVSRLNKLKKN